MGLAASQCRLLFLTSRQNDLSAKMQRISMEKMRLASDEDDAYDKYNRMLNKTKMQLKDGVDLSYEGLMGNAVYANGSGVPQIITDMSDNGGGRVVLSGALKSALFSQGGIPSNKLTGNKGDIKEIFSDPKALQTYLEGTSFVNNTGGTSGTGNATSEKTAWLEKVESFINDKGAYPTKSETKTATEVGSLLLDKGKTGNSTAYSITSLYKDGRDAEAAARTTINTAANDFVGSICNALGWTGDKKAGVKSTMKSWIDGQVNSSPLDYSYKGKDKDLDNNCKRVVQGGLWCHVVNTKGSDSHKCAVNHSELERRVFNKFCQLYAGQSVGTVSSNGCLTTLDNLDDITLGLTVNDKGYTIERWEAALKTLFNAQSYTSYTNFNTALADAKGVPGNNGNVGGNDPNAANTYCQTLWNSLNSYGWIVADLNTVVGNLQNGTYYLNNTTLSNNSDLYEEVADEEAKEEAKTWYDNELRKIKRKEDQWDTQLNRTQTEYTAITNDYNSVKSIIDANIQKSFTYCSNG